jgi:arylsulfatase
MRRRQFLAAAAGLPALAAAPVKRPNILLILADDLGFSDPGCFGGEIATPHIDRLARGGVRFTQFYNAARCCPSRASLMTGLYPHQTGVGNMVGGPPKDQNPPGYRGALNGRHTTIPAALRDSGYATLMSGKWHLGQQPGPVDRGFDEFFGMVHGFDSSWDASKYTRLPKGRTTRAYRDGEFYATGAITDHAIDFTAGARAAGKPWFLYLAYNAPHFPLHAPRHLIDKYQPVYEKGWDAIRESRFARLRDMGLIDKRWEITPRSVIPPNRVATPHGWANKANPAWESVEPERRTDLARHMAVYAAMVEAMDTNIGRVLADLERNNELENTLILFFSDNGACAEWDPWGFDVRSGPDNILHRGEALATMGQPGTYHSYGSAWANACGTPWRLYKHYNHEGGITTPFIAHWPAAISRRGAIEHQPGHLIDILPTFLDAAGARYPAGGDVPPAEGVSLLPAMRGRRLRPRPLFWEHEGNRAVRDGRWKAAALDPGGKWELYDMERDRTEMHDLAARHPERTRAMAAQWERWAKRTGALPWIWSPDYAATGRP